MIYLGWFFSYLLRNSAGNFSLFVSVLVLAILGYLLLDRFVFEARSKSKFGRGQIFKVSFFIGLLGGFFHAHVIQGKFAVQEPVLQKPFAVTVDSVSRRSFIGESRLNENRNIKIRFLSKPADVPLFSHDEVVVKVKSCKKLDGKKSLFNKLEILQRVHYHCYLEDMQRMSETPAWRLAVQKKVQEKLSQLNPTSLAGGFLLGQTDHIPFHSLSMFRKMGVAHIFSASGLHVGILSGIIILPFSLLGFTTLGFWAALIFSFFYLALLDFKVSLFRAFLFLLFFVVLKQLDKKTQSVYILLASTFVIELFAPLSLFTVSYILSAGITLIILYLFPVYRSILKRFVMERADHKKHSLKNKTKNKIKSFLIDHGALTLAAFSGSLFLSYIIFDYVNVLSLFYNFIMVPLTGVYLTFCLLLFAFYPFPVLAKFFIHAGDSFFYGLTSVHHNLFNRFFPTLLTPFMNYYLIVAFLLLFFLFYLFLNGKAWTIKKYGMIIFLGFFVSFFLQFPLKFSQNQGEKFYAFPYGVLYYQNGNIKIYGQAAKFMQKKLSLAKKLESLPVWNVSAQNNELVEKEKSFFGRIDRLEISSSSAALMRFTNKQNKMICVVFQSISRKNYWKPKEIAECENIYWVLSKKFRYKEKYAKKFFARFGFKGKIYKSKYFKWIQL